MINSTSLSEKLAVDVKGINDLRQAARQNSPEAVRATAKQFEALFMNMVMKSMREATPQEGIFDSSQSRMYTSMLDQQISQTMASRGVGLADVLTRQLSGMTGNSSLSGSDGRAPGDGLLPLQGEGWDGDGFQRRSITHPHPNPPLEGEGTRKPGSMSSVSSHSQSSHVRAFRERLASHAEEASRATGIPAKFMLGQAALESGWGKREIRAADGTASHNLFGIKATANWKGRVVEAATTEYVNGIPRTKMEKFRAYDSYADAFRDYAKLLRSNPRYENVLANAQDATSFAQGLQKAGYATDPNYAAKLTSIIKKSLSV